MTILTRDQIKAYNAQIPNRGQWGYFRTGAVLDSLVNDLGDSFALVSGQDFGVPAELEIFAGYNAGRSATTTLTDTGATALQTAIDNASDGDVIEVASNATYNPITLPADKGLVIRGALGYVPEISGQHGVLISDGTRDTLIARFQFPGCSTVNSNWKGAAVALDHQAQFDKVVLYQCSFPEVTNGSAVLVSYHQSISGDNYATSPVYPTEFSTKFGVIECNFFHACKDGTEGAAIAARGVEWLYVRGCTVNGNAVSSRGIMAQVCKNVWVSESLLHNFGSGNSEAIKLDRIGSTTEVTTAFILRNICHDCVEGIDADDYVGALIQDNLCYNCADEGISVDNDASALIVGNVTHNCADGIRADSGSTVDLRGNASFNNSSNNYRMDNGYSPDASNLTDPVDFGVAGNVFLRSFSAVMTEKIDFAYDDSSPLDIGNILPQNATVIGWMVQTDTTFDGTTPTLSIGDSGDADRIAQTTDIDLTVAGLDAGDCWVEYPSGAQVTGTLTLSGATQGAGSVLVKYVR